MLAPGLYSLRNNVKELVTILDHTEIEQLSDDEKLNWLRQNQYARIWNTQNEKSVWRTLLENNPNPLWISAPPHSTWPLRSVLALRAIHIRPLFPTFRDYSEYRLCLTSSQEKTKLDFLSQFPSSHNLIAIQPGAKDTTKIWPASKFRALAHKLTALPNTSVIFFLTEEERKMFSPELLGNSSDIKFVYEPLNILLPKLAACRLFIGNDSGFYHLSFALGLSVIGIFRSRRNLKKWSYRSTRSRAIYFYLPSPIRKHWHRYIPVQRLYKTSSAFLNVKTN